MSQSEIAQLVTRLFHPCCDVHLNFPSSININLVRHVQVLILNTTHQLISISMKNMCNPLFGTLQNIDSKSVPAHFRPLK